ncbi:hypothetical protein MASR2M78_23620 [Treponema sp.]
MKNLAMAFITLILLQPLFISAQDLAGNRPNDVVVALDISGSMQKHGVFQDVKAYIEKEFLRSLLKKGDRFTLITFGEEARLLSTRTISSDSDLTALIADLQDLKALSDFTDLGMALEKLDAEMASRLDGSYRPVAVFITDGKNAPPPESKYSGIDLSVDERFADTGKRIAQKGWLLYVVGLGEESDAKAVAEVVEGSSLSEGAEALKAAPVIEYLAGTSNKAESLALATQEASGGQDDKAGKSKDSSAESSGLLSSPFVLAFLIAVALVAIPLLVFVLKRKSSKEEEEEKEPKS